MGAFPTTQNLKSSTLSRLEVNTNKVEMITTWDDAEIDV
jgi:hypothetical protein